MSHSYPIDTQLVTGIDVGGTKVHILDNRDASLGRFVTADFPDLYAVLDAYFEQRQARPERIAIAMAGPRDDHTGAIKMTNSPWPLFVPEEAAARYPGTTFETYNDMAATTAGIVSAPSDTFKLLKGGVSEPTGNKAAASISTGFGLGIAAYNRSIDGYTLLDTEFGHTGFQPYTDVQKQFLDFLFSRYSDPSWELALSGKFGFDNWLEFLSDKIHAPKLGHSLELAVEAGRPSGAVLLEYATEGSGEDQAAAHQVLDCLAGLTATALSSIALAYKSTGGIYLTGSVSSALAEYWAESTGFNRAFIRHGSEDHAPWLEPYLEQVPIYLVIDPHIAVKGALALAM